MFTIKHIRDDQRGMTLVFVATGFLAFMAATTLAIDVGLFMTSRAQAQNSADAGALAGAVALTYDSYTDRSPTGPAVTSAIAMAQGNRVARELVSVNPSDVTFPLSPTGQDNRVKVDVFRTAGRFNPVTTLVGEFFGVDNVDITATATAEASPANAATCVKPFTIPDRWDEHQTAPWDTLDDTFDLYRPNGDPMADPDVYVPADQPGYTGYNAVRDRGMTVRLKAAIGNNVAPSFFNPWAIPGGIGADWYEANIFGCNTSVIPIGALMTAEPGDMVGPTAHGTDALIARDPGAHWNTACQCVQGSAFAKSPRVVVIPLYDPVFYEEGKHNGRNADLKIANYLGVFIEGMVGNEVLAKITPVGGLLQGGLGPAPAGAFPVVIRLVQ